MEILTFIIVVALAFIYEIIDSATGQGYGTLSTPTLLLIGFNVVYIVPCILISQAIGGFIGGIAHHRIGNYDLRNNHIDRTNIIMLVMIGIIGIFVGIYALSKLPSIIINAYIGILIIIIGIIIVIGIKFTYSKIKMFIVSILACFNKGLTGGGYGPLATGGQVVTGCGIRNAVGITTIAEAPICVTGFTIWCILNHQIPPIDLLIATCTGAALSPVLGAKLTKSASEILGNKFTKIVGVIILILGVFTIYKIFKY